MKHNTKIFSVSIFALMAICFAPLDNAKAAERVAVRNAPVARKSITVVSAPVEKPETAIQAPAQTQAAAPVSQPETTAPVVKEAVIVDKSDFFQNCGEDTDGASDEDTDFADRILKKRAAYAASEAKDAAEQNQDNPQKSSSAICDNDLRKCMQQKCGDDFTKCALDGDTIFGDKLNACRRDTNCTAHEFELFGAEIRADRDANVHLASYKTVQTCGTNYMKCIVRECGADFNQCLGKANADIAMQRCESIAKECKESDSGLTSRLSVVFGKLRENAESGVKIDEARLYELRDLMRSRCERFGAEFDERSLECVYSVKFFAEADGNTTTLLASRKAYAGDSFTCTQEWFGINATTYKENAYRETRAQTGASSAVLGAGVGSAVGLAASGAIGRAADTRNAKEELKAEEKLQAADAKAQAKVAAQNAKIKKQQEKQKARVDKKAAKVK